VYVWLKREPILSFALCQFQNMSQDVEPQRLTIEEEQTRPYRRFNARGTQLTVRRLPPPEGEDPNPMSHFLHSDNYSSTHYEISMIAIWLKLQLVMKLR